VLRFCSAGDQEARLHAHLGLGNHGNPWENFVLGMLAFRLQGVGEHIIFNGKQAAKEIDS
jgi:hypothetical protein